MVICSKIKLTFIFLGGEAAASKAGMKAPAASGVDVGQAHMSRGALTRMGVPFGRKNKCGRTHFYPHQPPLPLMLLL